MDRSLRLYIGGVNGVGKTSICKLLAKKLNLDYLSGSGLLLKYLKLRKQEDLHLLSEVEKVEIAREIIAPEIKKRKRVVFDTHFLVISGENTEEELFLDEYKNLFNYLILVLADPKIIYKRRRLNIDERKRRLNLKELVYEQQRSIKIAEELSMKKDIPLIKVDNSNYSIESVTEEIIIRINQA